MDYRFAIVTCLCIIYDVCGYDVVHVSEYSSVGVADVETGMLTGTGERMHFLLGREVRKKYQDLLTYGGKRELGNEDIEVWSSGTASAQVSAQAQLASLFPEGTGLAVSTPKDKTSYSPPFEEERDLLGGPPEEGEIDSLPFGFRLIPFISGSDDFDFIFYSNMSKTCPKLHSSVSERQEVMYNHYDHLLEDTRKALEERGFYSSEYYDVGRWDMSTMSRLYEYLYAYASTHDTPHPSADDSMMRNLSIVHSIKQTLDLYDDTVMGLVFTGVEKELVRGIGDFVEGKSEKKKFRMFVGSAQWIHSFLLRSNMTSLKCMIDKLKGGNSSETDGVRCEGHPLPASTIIYELSVREKVYYMRVLYNNEAVHVCGEDREYCEFALFASLSDGFRSTLNDSKDACNNPYVQASLTPVRTVYVHPEYERPIIIILWVSLACITTLLLLHCKCRKRRRSDYTVYSSSFVYNHHSRMFNDISPYTQLRKKKNTKEFKIVPIEVRDYD